VHEYYKTMNRSIFWIALVTFVPSRFAHGEQVLVLPASNAAAIICFFIFALFWRERVLIKIVVFALLCLGVVSHGVCLSSHAEPLSWRVTPGRIFHRGFRHPCRHDGGGLVRDSTISSR
jgi:hypothetical protein